MRPARFAPKERRREGGDEDGGMEVRAGGGPGAALQRRGLGPRPAVRSGGRIHLLARPNTGMGRGDGGVRLMNRGYCQEQGQRRPEQAPHSDVPRLGAMHAGSIGEIGRDLSPDVANRSPGDRCRSSPADPIRKWLMGLKMPVHARVWPGRAGVYAADGPTFPDRRIRPRSRPCFTEREVVSPLSTLDDGVDTRG